MDAVLQNSDSVWIGDGIVCKQMLMGAKVQIRKMSQKTEPTGRSPLRRGRSILDCSAIEEEEEEIFKCGCTCL